MSDVKEAPAKAERDVEGDAPEPGYRDRSPKHGGGPREMGREPTENAGEAMERQATIRPVHGDHSLDPVTTPWDIARLAGYGDDAYETMQGIDDLVMGRRDAMREARVESETEGGPLDLEVHESLYSDDADFGDLNTGLREGERIGDCDWCRELRGER